mgnify:CR=1 FL=1
MPKPTFWKLTAEKQERIKAAICQEFLRVPFEEASIKRIVEDAKIPRGSFYQYFEDKADAFEYLLNEEAEHSGETFQVSAANDLDIFNLMESIFLRELDHVQKNENLTKANLLSQIAKSPVAMDIFTNTMIDALEDEEWFVSEFMEICSSRDYLEPIIEMAISALKEAILSLLNAQQNTDEIHKKLRVKLSIIRLGIQKLPS